MHLPFSSSSSLDPKGVNTLTPKGVNASAFDHERNFGLITLLFGYQQKNSLNMNKSLLHAKYFAKSFSVVA